MSNSSTFIAHIRDLIAKDEIKTAIQQLSALLKDSPQLDEVVQQSARHNNVLKQIRLGLIDFESANITQNQIRNGILQLLRDIEEQELTQPSIKAEVERFAVKNSVNQSTVTAGGNVNIGDTNMNHWGSGDNVQGDKHQYFYYGDRKIPRYLTQKPFHTDFFIGRDKDLEAIETDYLQHNRLLMLVNGEGGMGKTTLAAQYWFIHERRYKHLAWIFAYSGIGNALLSLANTLGVQFNPQDDLRTQIDRITMAVSNLDAPCLFVFDNANNTDDLKKYFVSLKKLTNCHILLTSRVAKLDNTPIHRVERLENQYAVAIFKKYYPKLSATEGVLLNKLLDAVGYNTLVIELLAKNLAIFNDFEATYSLEHLVIDLQNKGLFGIQNEEITVVYQSDTLRTETPERIIEAMYDLADLSAMEKYLLNNFAVLPAENIPFTYLKDLIKPNDTPSFKTALRSLHQKGWIDFYENTNEFRISPVIQHITKRKNAETLLNDCDTLIDTLIDELHHDKIHTDNYKMSTIFVRYAETVVPVFAIPHYNVALLCERIGIYYTTLGNLDKALGFYEERNRLGKELYAAYPNNADFKQGLSSSYQFLGISHSSLGNLDKALGFYGEMNKLFKELYATYPNNVEFKKGLSWSYQFLGISHSSLGNLDKALGFYGEMNKLFKELYATYPNNVEFKKGLAISYSKLGETHTYLGNLDKPLGFYEASYKLMKELYAAYPNNVDFKSGLAASYAQLGATHANLGNLDRALEFYEDDIKLSKELYADYPNNVSFNYNYALSLTYLGKIILITKGFKKSKPYYEQAYQVFSDLYSKTQIPSYYEQMKDLEPMLKMNGIFSPILINIFMLLIKIPFIRREIRFP